MRALLMTTVLTVLARHNAKLGLLFLDIKRAAEALAKMV